MKHEQVKELLLQSLEHEKCGVEVYQTALQCVRNDDLKEELRKYHGQTRTHVQILTDLCVRMEIDPDAMTPGREVVRMMGDSLVEAMRKAGQAGKPDAAEIVACECVALAEMKDHLDWELIGQVAKSAKGEQMQALKDAYDEVEDQEDEHLYHSRGWARELHLQALGLNAVLPPPEEKRHVKTAIEAARAQKSAGH
ncbi:MAG TPA: hypothetical protein VLY46_16660 [Usitatibacter sp.]|nr:hypothetical protein [Usitatibacter sp.]